MPESKCSECGGAFPVGSLEEVDLMLMDTNECLATVLVCPTCIAEVDATDDCPTCHGRGCPDCMDEDDPREDR